MYSPSPTLDCVRDFAIYFNFWTAIEEVDCEFLCLAFWFLLYKMYIAVFVPFCTCKEVTYFHLWLNTMITLSLSLCDNNLELKAEAFGVKPKTEKGTQGGNSTVIDKT